VVYLASDSMRETVPLAQKTNVPKEGNDRVGHLGKREGRGVQEEGREGLFRGGRIKGKPPVGRERNVDAGVSRDPAERERLIRHTGARERERGLRESLSNVS